MMEVFPQSICFRFKLLRVLETAGQKVLTYTLLCGTVGKSPTIPLDKYLNTLPKSSKARYSKFNSEQRKNCFNKTEKKQINDDTSCSTFDISLLWKAITVACERWQDTDNEADSLVTKIKNTRNEVVHETLLNMTEEEFLTKLKYLKDIFAKTLDATQVKYRTNRAKCEEKKREVIKLVDDIRQENLGKEEILQRSVTDIMPFFKREADEELRGKLSSARFLDPLRFLSSHEDHRVDVQDIFSKIIIKEELSAENEIHHLKILTCIQDSCSHSSPHLLMVEGDAGSGKTTLLTYTLSEYLKNESDRSMEGLNHYDILLWVACREESSTSLESLIKKLLSDAHYKYGNLLFPLVRRSSVLILIDGLDEQNDDSRRLVRDILNECKNCHTFTLLSTSRPEAILAMKANVPKNFKIFHLRLEGVSVGERTKLALRHYRWLCAGVPKDDAHLRQVMEQIGWKDLFRLPLNLLFLATFFYYEPQKLTTTITQTELYQNILDWCIEKLRQRLLSCPTVPAGVFLQAKIKSFLMKCYEIALKGLIQSKIYLNDEDLNDLNDVCNRNGLPVEQVLPAFYSLRRKAMGGVMKERYYAPHKGLQDFFAAQHIHLRLSNYKQGDILHVLQDSTPGQDLHLQPLSNMLCHLLGLLSCQDKPMVTAIEETVDLIQKSKMKGINSWLSVLANMKAHPDIIKRVAHHINSHRDDSAISIKDANVHIAAALLPLIPCRNVEIELMRDDKVIEALFPVLGCHTLQYLNLENHFRHPRPAASSVHILKQVPRCDLWAFKGHLDGQHLTLLPQRLGCLSLVVAGDGHAQSVLPALEQICKIPPALRELCIHIPVSAVTSGSLSSLPNSPRHFFTCGVSVCLSGVGNGEVEAVIGIAAALCPKEVGFWGLLFPGASLGVDGWTRILQGLAVAHVRVRRFDVPDTIITKDEEKQLQTLAQYLLRCRFGRNPEHILWLPWY